MQQQSTQKDEAWGALGSAPEAEREAAMLTRYNELAVLPEEERNTRLVAMANAEYALPDEGLKAMTLGRLRTLLRMQPDQATLLINAYNGVMQHMSAGAAMRRVTLVQTLTADFSGEDEERLRVMIPSMFAASPKRTGLEADPSSFAVVAGTAKKKPFWAFWQKG